MNRAVVVGARGFVGSAFVRYLKQRPIELIEVTSQNYPEHAGCAADVVIQAACNSRKYLADQDPVAEFELSVTHCLRTLRDFPAALHVHISSVDVYADLANPAANTEESSIDVARISKYGLHKLLAEELVRHYASRWLIVRLAGMVGPGLRKNPVFDVLNNQPLRIHPDSQYQFATTDIVAERVWHLVEGGGAGLTPQIHPVQPHCPTTGTSARWQVWRRERAREPCPGGGRGQVLKGACPTGACYTRACNR